MNVSEAHFDQVALNLFSFQFTHNPVYRQFSTLIGRTPERVCAPEDIPFLPIQLFKSGLIQTGRWSPGLIFESSGTTGQARSRHALRSPAWYARMCEQSFSHAYGSPSEYCWLALLPSYLERKNASLVHMVDHFIRMSKFEQSGFFLDETGRLKTILEKNESEGIPTVLIGVSFAMLDLAESGADMELKHTIVMETGGMKGRRKELTREALHTSIRKAFHVAHVHSEYGMTEMLSQCYAKEAGVFRPSPTVKVLIGDLTDPLSLVGPGIRGTIQVIDLGNLDTCAFIATQDVGISREDGAFKVLGRIDESEMRGCNLMVSDL